MNTKSLYAIERDNLIPIYYFDMGLLRSKAPHLYRKLEKPHMREKTCLISGRVFGHCLLRKVNRERLVTRGTIEKQFVSPVSFHK
jgi:hypothetical protein